MIRPARRRHDVIFVALALLLPALFVTALAARPDATASFGDVPAILYGGADGVMPANATSTPAVADPAGAAGRFTLPLPAGMGAALALHRPSPSELPAPEDKTGDAQERAEPRLTKAAPAPTLLLEINDVPPSPGLLLYWVPGHPPATNTAGELPDGALLIGAPRPRTALRYPLPRAALDGDGSLVLYSLGHQRLVGESVVLDSTALSALSANESAAR